MTISDAEHQKARTPGRMQSIWVCTRCPTEGPVFEEVHHYGKTRPHAKILF